MITTRLKKDRSTKSLLVEFSLSALPPALQELYVDCKEEGVRVRRGSVQAHELTFYSVEGTSGAEVRGVRVEDTPGELQFVLSVLYIRSEGEEAGLEDSPPLRRTLLVREGLDLKFYHEYEFENTESELESTVLLCELAAAIINSPGDQPASFYDQKAEGIKGAPKVDLRECLWRNVFYQIPGLGKEKCTAIAARFPNYEALLEDYRTGRQLKNVAVSRGVREIRLGAVLANRIYRCLFTEDGSASVLEEGEGL